MTIVNKTKLMEASLRDNYIRACKSNQFKSLVASLDLPEKEIMKYTSKLEDYLAEQENCKNCKSIMECKNKVKGYTDYPKNYNGHLMFSCEACCYKVQEREKIKNATTASRELDAASLKSIDTTDKNRYSLIKWVTKFIKEYDYGKNMKGLYLHGNFGCGKTYIISACLNELRKKGFKTMTIYLPDLYRSIRNDFDNMNEIIDEISRVDLLLIDDIGAEKVTDWGRDEVLMPILQSRMNNHKTTFFTSNFTIIELENHLSNKGVDKVAASRVIERIKQLTEDLEMISKNMRK